MTFIQCDVVRKFLFGAYGRQNLVAIGAAFEMPRLIRPGDFNCDGDVNGIDLGNFLVKLQQRACDECPEDLNHDGRVDTTDLGLLLGFWDDCP